MNMQEVRAKYPQYSDMSDGQLADALHAKYYSDMPKEKFYSSVGFKAEETKPDYLRQVGLAGGSMFKGAMALPDLVANAGRGAINVGSSLLEKIPGVPKQNRLGTQSANDLLLAAGAAQPANPTERVTDDIITGGIGATASPASGMGALLAGGLGGGAAGLTREGGGGAGAQITAGLLAGLSPSALASLAKLPIFRDVIVVAGAGFGNKSAVKTLAEENANRVSGADKDFIKAAEFNKTNFLGDGVPVTTAQAIAQRNQMTPDVRAGATVKLQQDLSGGQGATDILPSVAKRQFTAMETPLQGLAGGADRATQNASQDLAKQFRSDNAGKQYEALAATRVRINNTLATLMESPAGSTATRLAKDIADNDAAARLAAGKPAIPFALTNQDGKVTGFTAQGLQYVKSALDDMATNKTLQGSLGISGTGTNKVSDVRGGLIDFMNLKIPGWQKAREAYSAQSEPLNQLQVGQALLDKFRNEKGSPTAQTFLNARGRGEDALLKRSTGAGREVNFDAQGEAALSGVQNHLLRDEAVKRIGGEVKGVNGSGLASQDIPQLPNLLSRTAMIANYGLRMFGKSANDPVANLIAQKMANGTYHELLQRPAGDPLRTAAEAAMRAALGTNAAMEGSP